MGEMWLWLAAAAWCWGFTAGIAWAAQWRPTRIEVVTRIKATDDA